MIFPSLIIKIERWKFNKDYGVYVSTLGRFKDRYKRRLPIRVYKSGYCCVQTEQGIKLSHRLVMMTWRPIPDAEMLTVDHLNHNKRDNSLENLEWVSKQENENRAKRDLISLNEGESESTCCCRYIINGQTFSNLNEAVIWTKENRPKMASRTIETGHVTEEEIDKKIVGILNKKVEHLNQAARKVNTYGYNIQVMQYLKKGRNMAKYNIYAGMGGGFGGANYCGTLECDTEEEAAQFAYEQAVEEYQSYEGMHGVLSWEDCYDNFLEESDTIEMSEDEIAEEVDSIYNEEIEGWIDYWAVLATEDTELNEEDYYEL